MKTLIAFICLTVAIASAFRVERHHIIAPKRYEDRAALHKPSAFEHSFDKTQKPSLKKEADELEFETFLPPKAQPKVNRIDFTKDDRENFGKKMQQRYHDKGGLYKYDGKQKKMSADEPFFGVYGEVEHLEDQAKRLKGKRAEFDKMNYVFAHVPLRQGAQIKFGKAQRNLGKGTKFLVGGSEAGEHMHQAHEGYDRLLDSYSELDDANTSFRKINLIGNLKALDEEGDEVFQASDYLKKTMDGKWQYGKADDDEMKEYSYQKHIPKFIEVGRPGGSKFDMFGF